MREKGMREILGDFAKDAARLEAESKRPDKTTLSFWVPVDRKTRYSKLHRSTRRAIIKKMQEVFDAVLEMVEAEAKAS
jgi:23S rRNA A2030 N6-methylase RlmJ